MDLHLFHLISNILNFFISFYGTVIHLRSPINLLLIFCFLLFILLYLNLVYDTLFNLPRKLISSPRGERFDYFSSTKISDKRLVISLENKTKTIFFIGHFETENSINTFKLLFIMVVTELDLKKFICLRGNLDFLFYLLDKLFLLDLLILFFGLRNYCFLLLMNRLNNFLFFFFLAWQCFALCNWLFYSWMPQICVLFHRFAFNTHRFHRDS